MVGRQDPAKSHSATRCLSPRALSERHAAALRPSHPGKGVFLILPRKEKQLRAPLLSGGYILRLVTILTVLIVFIFGTGQAALGGNRIERDQGQVKNIICKVFGPYCNEALRVSWCESRWDVRAENGQYLGLFQMGYRARVKYGHSLNAWVQARAAKRYFIDSGKDWSPWSCKP